MSLSRRSDKLPTLMLFILRITLGITFAIPPEDRDTIRT